MATTIGVLGAGWLGKPLAHFLQQNNYNVKVSVSSSEKQQQLLQEQLNAFVVKINTQEIEGNEAFFEKIDVLIVSLPPVDRDIFSMMVDTIKKRGIKKIVLFSSIGIYTDCENWVTEETTLNLHLPKVKHLKTIEDLFLTEDAFDTTVLRLGGLMGDNRHPVKSLAKKEWIDAGNEPVNLVKQEEAIACIFALLEKPLVSSVFNVVNSDHRTKEVFYTEEANKLNLTLPPFVAVPLPKNRKVSSEKLAQYLNKKS